MTENDLTMMSTEELVDALFADNALATEFDRLDIWKKVDSWNWCRLLFKQPQFADKCDKWDKFYPEYWCSLLSRQPQFVNKANDYCCWCKFGFKEWYGLLLAQPQFWIYCPSEWVKKIIENPERASECKLWDWFSSLDWAKLLLIHPQFVDKCDWSKLKANNDDEYPLRKIGDDYNEWKRVNGRNYSNAWKKLLLSQPQFVEYFTDNLWDGFSQEQWDELEATNPEVYSSKRMLSNLRKLAEL